VTGPAHGDLGGANPGVTAPRGFRAAGVAAGLKASGVLDVAVVVNDGPEHAAAVVTTSNRVKAAPVVWTDRVVGDGQLRAAVLNSGGANACTGQGGRADVVTTATLAAGLLGCSPDEVAVCSTGLIGVRLPLQQLTGGVRAAIESLSTQGGTDAATAILTTDSVIKTEVAAVGGVTIGAMAKGAGMLAPALATMLVVITTDAVVAPATLDSALRTATAATFDRLDSDGCQSTNDTVLVMASGAANVMVGRDLPEREFAQALTAVCASLVRQLLADAEGASKQIDVTVSNALTETDALTVARAVARSNLFKCAIHGEDPNWGRVLAAVGTADATFDPDSLSVSLNGVLVCAEGAAAAGEPVVDLSNDHVVVEIDLASGSEQATVWTSDLTAAYVHENSMYST
jgi:glutamate N-acetyltransferase/amino-acid N-acetyltransferase